MSDRSNSDKRRPRPTVMEIEQIKQIYDYTKYHIGLYSTLLSGLIAIITFSRGEKSGQQNRSAIFTIIIMLLIGGIAGALVASKIVYGHWGKKVFLIEKSWFWKKRPSKLRKWRLEWPFNNWWWSWASICLTIEHYAFWAALFYAIWKFARY